MGILLKKGTTDDLLIKALQEEVAKFKNKTFKGTNQNDGIVQSYKETIMHQESEISFLKNTIQKLENKTNVNVKHLKHESSQDSSNHHKLLVESLKAEIEPLRSSKAKLENALAEERKNINYLRKCCN